MATLTIAIFKLSSYCTNLFGAVLSQLASFRHRLWWRHLSPVWYKGRPGDCRLLARQHHMRHYQHLFFALWAAPIRWLRRLYAFNFNMSLLLNTFTCQHILSTVHLYVFCSQLQRVGRAKAGTCRYVLIK